MRKVLISLAITLMFAMFLFAALTDSQARTEATKRWPGKAMTAMVWREGSTSIQRWVGFDNGFGTMTVRGRCAGCTWDAALADADSKTVTGIPAPSKPKPYGPFLVETDPQFDYINNPQFLMSATADLEYGTTQEIKHRLKTALFNIRKLDPAKFDAILAECHCTIEAW